MINLIKLTMILIMLPIFNIVYGQDKIDIKKMEIKYDAIQMNFQEFQRLIYPEFEIHDKNDSIYILLDKKIIGVNKESLEIINQYLVNRKFTIISDSLRIRKITPRLEITSLIKIEIND